MPDLLEILIIDDNEVDRELVRRLLELPARFREAATAAEARAALAEAEPDLALLDYRLPDADGVELLPEFTRRAVPVVMLTGVEMPEIIVDAMRGGALDYLVKGALTPEGLERAIVNAVEKAALRRAVEEQQRVLAEQARALEARNREIRALASALTLAEQEERRRIADLLHDHLQQLLFGAKLSLQVLRRPPGGVAAERLAEVERILDEAVSMARNLAVELTPPVLEEEELEVALRWLAGHMGAMYSLEIEVRAEDVCRVPTREVRVLLLQLVRELVFNIVKHAGVGRAEIHLAEREGEYVIAVEDEGRGFDVAAVSAGSDAAGRPRGYGLYSVRQRLELLGGYLRIDSAPGRGTRVWIHAPVRAGA